MAGTNLWIGWFYSGHSGFHPLSFQKRKFFELFLSFEKYKILLFKNVSCIRVHSGLCLVLVVADLSKNCVSSELLFEEKLYISN